MKKLFLIALFFTSFLSKAEFLTATLHFNDGTVKIGFAQLVETDDEIIKFRAGPYADVERIPSACLFKIELTDKNENEYLVVRKKTWSMSSFSYKYFEEKEWLYQIEERERYVYLASVTKPLYRKGAISYYRTFAPMSFFYYSKKDDDVAYLGFSQTEAHNAVHTSRRRQIRKMVKEMFKGNCNLDAEIDKIKFDRKSGEDPFKVLEILVNSKCN